MPIALKPLERSQCRLIPEGESALVDRFNELLNVLGQLRTESAGLSGFAEKIAEVESMFDRVRLKLTRSHYRVGFLGTTQAGKSTTFNNILKVTSDDAPAKSGGGAATTAAPARLRRSPNNERTVRLNYMTDADYQQRRHRLAEQMKLGDVLTEDDQLSRCAELRERHERGEILSVAKDDAVALHLLIQSRRKFQSLVHNGPPRHSRSGDYGDRALYLNHDAKAAVLPTENRLLWEVEIEFPNDFLPHSLEMIDLPGLGATSYHDTCVTLDIIENQGIDGLDGALIFVKADVLGDAQVQEIIQKLQNAWGKRFQGRVWMVLTKYDVLTDPHFKNDEDWFSSVNHRMREYDIPSDCVFVVSNKAVDALKPEMDDQKRLEVSSLIFGRKIESPEVAKHLERYPYFQDIIRQVYLNGGLEKLRNAIQNRLKEMIGREVADDVKGQLSLIHTNLDYLLKTAKRRKTQTSDDQEKAIACAKALNRVILQVRRGLPEFRDSTLNLRNGMVDALKKYAPVDDLADMAEQDIPANFRMLANRLDQETRRLVIDQGVEKIYEAITRGVQDMPPLPLAGAETIQQAWANTLNADCEYDRWQSLIPRFEEPDLIRMLCESADRLRGPQFKTLLENKIHSVTLVTMFRVRERLMNHLSDMSNELKLLVTGQLP